MTFCCLKSGSSLLIPVDAFQSRLSGLKSIKFEYRHYWNHNKPESTFIKIKSLINDKFQTSYKKVLKNAKYQAPSPIPTHLHPHCVESVRIRSYSGPYLVRMQENTDQNNSEYGHFLRSDSGKFGFKVR